VNDLILRRLQYLSDSTLRLSLPENELARLYRLDEISSFDSLARVEFLSAVETEFGFRFEPALMTSDLLVDLRDLAEHISARLGPTC
jgi:acyl carrier protein